MNLFVLLVRSSLFRGAVKGADVLQVKVLPGELTVHPSSYGSGQVGQLICSKPPGKESEQSGCNLAGRNASEP
jgi:hypothetical protein